MRAVDQALLPPQEFKQKKTRQALLVRMAAFNETHALEEQEQQIKRKKEQQELDTSLNLLCYRPLIAGQRYPMQ